MSDNENSPSNIFSEEKVQSLFHPIQDTRVPTKAQTSWCRECMKPHVSESLGCTNCGSLFITDSSPYVSEEGSSSNGGHIAAARPLSKWTGSALGSDISHPLGSEISHESAPVPDHIIFRGKAFDISKFQEKHPGGKESIQSVHGTDATDIFENVGHSEDALKVLMCLPQLSSISLPQSPLISIHLKPFIKSPLPELQLSDQHANNTILHIKQRYSQHTKLPVSGIQLYNASKLCVDGLPLSYLSRERSVTLWVLVKRDMLAGFNKDGLANQESVHALIGDKELDDSNSFHDADTQSRVLEGLGGKTVLRPIAQVHLNRRLWTQPEAAKLFKILETGFGSLSDLLEARRFPQMSDFPAEFSGRSILGTALESRHAGRFVEILLQYGADPNEIVEKAGKRMSALTYAIKTEASTDIIRSLLSYGANPNVEHDGQVALAILLEQLVDDDIPDLNIEQVQRKKSMITDLIHAGVDPCIRDNLGRPAVNIISNYLVNGEVSGGKAHQVSLVVEELNRISGMVATAAAQKQKEYASKPSVVERNKAINSLSAGSKTLLLEDGSVLTSREADYARRGNLCEADTLDQKRQHEFFARTQLWYRIINPEAMPLYWIHPDAPMEEIDRKKWDFWYACDQSNETQVFWEQNSGFWLERSSMGAHVGVFRENFLPNTSGLRSALKYSDKMAKVGDRYITSMDGLWVVSIV